METKIEISKILIQLSDDTTVWLTIEEAKRLRDVLLEAFPREQQTKYLPYPCYYPCPPDTIP
jgi:hypothetical protein